MKKFIYLLVVLSICLCGCSGETQQKNSTSEETVPHNLIASEFYINAGADTLADRIKAAAGISNVTVTYGDTVTDENGNETGSIAVTIGENTVTMPMFSYDCSNKYDRYTGGFRTYKDSFLYYYGDSVQIYSLPGLERMNYDDFSAIEGRYIEAVNRYGDDYYLLYTGVEKEGFGKIGANGKFVDMPVADGYDGNFFSSENNHPDIDYIDLNLYGERYTLYYFEVNGEEWLMVDNALLATDEFMYSITNGNMFYVQQTLFSENEESNVQVRIISCSPAGYYTVKSPENLAMRVENGTITHLFPFDGEISGAMYMNSDYDGAYGLRVRRNDEFTAVDFYHRGCQQGVEVDFDRQTAKIYHHNLTLPPENRAMESYKDEGQLSLYSYSAYGGGDVSVNTVVLRDERFGWLKYIDDVGGMYGGGESVGFFSNGDIYSISYDDFKIYTNDFKEEGPIFRLSDNFPMGSYVSETVGRRVLFAARRNPDDHSFIVLYTDIPYCDRYNDMWTDTSYVRLKSDYKVGILDNTGKLIKSYSTGENAGLSGFYGVDMYLEGDNLHFVEWVKGPDNVNIHCVVNLETGKYRTVTEK
ncbi:MAG: hypothetical protein IKU54_06930 [Oscillospiraceae bacterium]|nr:hypothetical protein [Oscillospiraceae bacterium]